MSDNGKLDFQDGKQIKDEDDGDWSHCSPSRFTTEDKANGITG